MHLRMYPLSCTMPALVKRSNTSIDTAVALTGRHATRSTRHTPKVAADIGLTAAAEALTGAAAGGAADFWSSAAADECLWSAPPASVAAAAGAEAGAGEAGGAEAAAGEAAPKWLSEIHRFCA
jgi:hypothetical protein